MTDQQRVLITGATGFIGRHLCDYLIAKGYKVRGTFRAKKPTALSEKIEWVHIEDIGPETEWSNVLASVDYVVHLAALAHQIGRKAEGRTIEFQSINADGTRQLASAATFSPSVRRLVFVSSIGVVKALSSAQITATSPCEPENDYGRSKLSAEHYIQEIMETCAADWCIIRPTLVYGPGNPGNMERLMKLIQTKLPLPFGAIENQRSFLYVGNLIDLIERCLCHPQAGRQVFLASDGEDLSTPDLIRRIAQVSEQKVSLIPVPIGILRMMGLLGDMSERLTGKSVGIDSYSVERLVGSMWVDLSPLIEFLDWHPPYSVDAGLKSTLKNTQ